jgi:hypothetical protein
MQVGIADDGVLLGGSDAEISADVAKWQSMGVDTVRVFARWLAIAPGGDAKKMPAGFDPKNPNDPQYKFAALDRAVNAVNGSGMKVILTITGSGPRWSTEHPSAPKNEGRQDPSPAKYADFAAAVAKRYGSVVDTYILYNEPNQILWLQPQFKCKSGRCKPHSPHQYRRMVNAAEPAVRAADPTAKILLGALAPSGQSETTRSRRSVLNKNMRPLQFLREFACVDRKFRKIRSGECRHFKAATADGFSYHPHGIKRAPNAKTLQRDDAQMADLSRLTKTLDRITSRGRIKVRGATRLPLYLTEYAYQTNPPDKFIGVSLTKQATYLQQGAFIGWRNPRVQNLTQYVYKDDTGSTYGWQSGLLFSDGSPKPSFKVFPIPFWAQHSGTGKTQLWGQVRPGSGVRTVDLQRRSGNTWISIGSVATNADGYYTRTVDQTKATTYRAVTPEGATASRTVFGV